METLFKDIGYGARSLLKHRSFTAIALITLALGIGVNTAIFSVVNAVLLRPVPFSESDRLMTVWATDKGERYPISYLDFADWRAQSKSFETLAAYHTVGLTLTGAADSVRLRGAVVTADLFPMLRVKPVIGRTFVPEDEKAGVHAVILSHGLWQRSFGSASDVLSQTVTLNNQSFNVVGVMPDGFHFPIQNEPAELWITTAIDAEGPVPLTTQRGNLALNVIGRLRNGVTVAQSRTEMAAIVERLGKQYPDTSAWPAVQIITLLDYLVGDVKRALLIIFAAVGCVLLIASANVASLTLVRAVTRHKEVAIRTALGASRLRVVRQLLTESLMLALGGGALGLVLAWWASSSLLALAPPGLPRIAEIGLDSRVWIFATLVSFFSGLVASIAPISQSFKTDITKVLNEGGKGTRAGTRAHWLTRVLVVSEIAVALTVLVGAGLLVNSFLRLQRVNPGFNPQNVLTFRVSLPETKYAKPEQVNSFYQELIGKVETLPGVINVSSVAPLPLSGQVSAVGFSIQGLAHPATNPFPFESQFRTVNPDYFRTLGIQIIKGRDFTERDDLKSPPVVIINETLANQYFPGQGGLGQHINPSFAIDQHGPSMREIIGVVKDVKHDSLSGQPVPEIYVVHTQHPIAAMTLVARTTNDPNGLVAGIRRELKELDPQLPIERVLTLDQYLASSVAQPRFNTQLLTIFAGLALLLAAVGTYGVMSYSVSQRTHEIGIRVALGASSADVLRLILKGGMMLALMGIVIGLAGAFVLTRLMSSLLFGVTPTDGVTFALGSACLIVVAWLACYIPARRATKVDPLVALRYE